MKIFGRHRWTKTAPGGEHQEPHDAPMVIHHSAFGALNVNTFREQVNMLLSIRHFHVDVQGWDDIGYNFVVFQSRGRIRRARVFRARGPYRVPAAQEGHNTNSVAVCVCANNEPIRRGTVRALKKLYRHLDCCTSVKGHRDYNNTSCPGDRLYEQIGAIRRAK